VSRRLLVGYLSLTLVLLVVLEVPLGIAYQRSERRALQTKIERDAVSLASLAGPALASRTSLAPISRVAAAYAERTGERLLVVDATGTGVLDTNPAFPGERSFDTRSRPEIQAALAGRVASGGRFSRTLGHGLVYVAVPVASGGAVYGAVRVTYPTSRVDARLRRTWALLVLVALVALAAAALIGLAISRWIARPLAAVGDAAARIGEGELAARAPEHGPPEVREVARSLNETAAKLESLLRSQEAFVADASHQLRTPLTALRLRLENLGAGGADVEPALAEVERLGRLVDDLLALARADANEAPATAVDLAEVAAARVEAWAPLAAERGVELRAGREERPRVRASRERLEQVLDNLLANALEAARAGTAVDVVARRADGFVELHVVDEGPGLTTDERARAFDRFWRGNGRGAGSGLGLAIVKRLVEVDGGEVELREAVGGGVDAVVRLRQA
jgi:signal transduction histidine kinase